MELRKVVFCWMFLVTLNPICESTFDINPHQIQYIADHMSEEECTHLLMELGKRKKRIKQHKSSVRPKREVEKLEYGEEPSCIQELLKWNTKDGKGHTFYGLAASLERIKRPDLSHKLSRMVYKEKADAVRRTFLNDPFKKEIHTGSPLLAESPPAEPTTHYTEPIPWTGYHTSSAIFTTVFVIGIITCCIRRCCPKCSLCCDKACGAIRSAFYTQVVGIDIPSLEKRQSQVSLKKQSKISVKIQSQGSLDEENETLLKTESYVALNDGIIEGPGNNNMSVSPSESSTAADTENTG